MPLAAPPQSPPIAGSPQKPLSAMAQPERLADGGIGMQIIVPYWQKEYIHGMIEFVVVGIVSISA